MARRRRRKRPVVIVKVYRPGDAAGVTTVTPSTYKVDEQGRVRAPKKKPTG